MELMENLLPKKTTTIAHFEALVVFTNHSGWFHLSFFRLRHRESEWIFSILWCLSVRVKYLIKALRGCWKISPFCCSTRNSVSVQGLNRNRIACSKLSQSSAKLCIPHYHCPDVGRHSLLCKFTNLRVHSDMTTSIRLKLQCSIIRLAGQHGRT